MKTILPLSQELRAYLEKYRDELAGHVFTEQPEIFEMSYKKEINNVYVAGFLLYRGYSLHPKLNEETRRVEFIYTGDGNIDEAISEFYKDPLQSYLKCLRVVRNWVYGLKDLQAGEGMKNG